MKPEIARDAVEEFCVAPPGKSVRVFLSLFTLVIPLMIIVAMAAVPDLRPPPAVFAFAVTAIVAVAGALFAVIRRRAIRLGDGQLQIRATLYSRSVPLASIDLDSARVIDLREHPENRPLLKTNGLAVPGLAAGNFRDRKRRRLFCLVTAPRVLSLPLHDGTRVLISPVRPAQLLARIRERTSSRD